MKYDIYNGKLHSFFEPLKSKTEIELVFITTSFGGTGSGSVFELAEFVQAQLWSESYNRCISCFIVAFTQAILPFPFPNEILQCFEMNTVNFVSDSASAERNQDDDLFRYSIEERRFIPYTETYLIDEDKKSIEELYQILVLDSFAWRKIDAKQKYSISRLPSVFISYSTKNQNVADLLADTLDANGIKCWIATRNLKQGSYAGQIVRAIKDASIFVILLSPDSIESPYVKNEINVASEQMKNGMKIVPFVIEECVLDDDCQYYLSRYEMISGLTPPIVDRINDLVDMLKALFDR